LERPGDVFTLALETKNASKSGRLYHPCARNTNRRNIQWMFLALLQKTLEAAE